MGQTTDDTPLGVSDEAKPEAGYPTPQEDVTLHVAEDELAQVHSEAPMEVSPGPADHPDPAPKDRIEIGPNTRDAFPSMTPKLLMPPPVSAVSALAALLLLSIFATLMVLITGCTIPYFRMRWLHSIGQVVTSVRGMSTTESKASGGA